MLKNTVLIPKCADICPKMLLMNSLYTGQMHYIQIFFPHILLVQFLSKLLTEGLSPATDNPNKISTTSVAMQFLQKLVGINIIPAHKSEINNTFWGPIYPTFFQVFELINLLILMQKMSIQLIKATFDAKFVSCDIYMVTMLVL